MLCEPDFGVLDRLMQIKPMALDFVYEGLTMFAKNKTNLWRDQLSKEQLEMAMESARRFKQKQKDVCKKEIFQKKALHLQSNVEEKQPKEKLLALEKEKLLKQLNGLGGGGGRSTDVEKRLQMFFTDKEKKFALKVQFNFCQRVLGIKCKRSLFAMSSEGKGKSLKKLVRNFKEIISWNKERDYDKENTIDFSRPVFVMPAALSEEKESLKARALQATDKENKRFKDLTQKTSRKRAGENKIDCKKEKRIKKKKMKQIQ